jgi:hypothetical protein
MTITIELSDREVQFLNKMISDMASFEKISSMEESNQGMHKDSNV